MYKIRYEDSLENWIMARTEIKQYQGKGMDL
jgi:hypothetical protein